MSCVLHFSLNGQNKENAAYWDAMQWKETATEYIFDSLNKRDVMHQHVGAMAFFPFIWLCSMCKQRMKLRLSG